MARDNKYAAAAAFAHLRQTLDVYSQRLVCSGESIEIGASELLARTVLNEYLVIFHG
jgi:hypothetical protein